MKKRFREEQIGIGTETSGKWSCSSRNMPKNVSVRDDILCMEEKVRRDVSERVKEYESNGSDLSPKYVPIIS
jgi:hypothetical protein